MMESDFHSKSLSVLGVIKKQIRNISLKFPPLEKIEL